MTLANPHSARLNADRSRPDKSRETRPDKGVPQNSVRAGRTPEGNPFRGLAVTQCRVAAAGGFQGQGRLTGDSHRRRRVGQTET